MSKHLESKILFLLAPSEWKNSDNEYSEEKLSFNFDKPVTKKLGLFQPNAIIQTIYDSIINHHGCCLGILPKDSPLFLEEDGVDIFKKFDIVGKAFSEVPAEIRSEIVSIDGATLIEKDSNIIKEVARILPVNPSRNEGARTGAAKIIAEHGGVGIKVSEDGYVDVYAQTKENKIECVLSFGKGIFFD